MRIHLLSSVAVLSVILLLGSTAVYSQGGLTPSGPPGPTMVTLDQLQNVNTQVLAEVVGGRIEGGVERGVILTSVGRAEPRTAISSVPSVITESGSYYLAGSFSSTSHAVVVDADNVTLDLMGFTLSGDGGSPDCGILVTNSMAGGGRSNVKIRNGNVVNFGYGLYVEGVCYSAIEDVNVVSNLSGIYFNSVGGTARGNIVKGCTVGGNTNDGIYFYEMMLSANRGNVVSDCIVENNGDDGIVFSGSVSSANRSVVKECTVSGNGGVGVSFAGPCERNSVLDCVVQGNGGTGIRFSASLGSVDRNTVKGCKVDSNGGYGVSMYLGGLGSGAGNAIADCSIRENADGGVYMYDIDRGVVKECHLNGNGGSGAIYLYSSARNRIEANHCAGNLNYGVYVHGSGNFIFRNTCSGYTNSFGLVTDDIYGPIVTDTGALASTGDASHPLANFSQ